MLIEILCKTEGNKLNLSRIHGRLRLVFVLALMIFTVVAGKVSFAQDQVLSPEEIIQILQDNPDVLADAKQQIVSQLRDRGYNISIQEITDDRLFSQIRSDERVQQLASDFLTQRGFGPQQQQGEQQVNPQDQQQQPGAGAGTGQTGEPLAQPSPTPSGGRITGQQPQGSLPSDLRNLPSRTPTRTARPTPTPAKEKPPGPPQEQYPLRNLPALRDLYTQAIPDESKLERFGAALFRNSTAGAQDKSALNIPVGPDYVLGAGDEVVIDYWGASSQHLVRTVDREGRIGLPEAGSVVVAGRTLGEAQELVQKMLSRQLRGITVDVSLGKLRSVRAFIVGDVKNPGAYDISSLSTVLSALIAAGGPTESGSYRIVKHYRGKALVEEVDLYDLMLKGVSSSQVHIESGDSILVPPVGAQVTVAGKVRRPAIYELRQEQTLDQVLDLAGGVPVTGELTRIKVERVEAHERKEMLSVNVGGSTNVAAQDAFGKFHIQDGDVVTVSPILPYSNRTVYLQGHVFRPGKYPYKDGFKVTDLIHSYDDVLPEPSNHGEIIRLHPPDFTPTVIPFNLHDVLAKTVPAPSLEPFDTVRIVGRYDADAPKVSIFGEVLRPGEYPLAERMTAADLLRMAGGFKRSAYRPAADLTSYVVVDGDHIDLEHREVQIDRALGGEADTDVLLKPGDVLTIRQIGGWTDIGASITVTGEVMHPGRYGIERGERLSSILRRAGGFSSEAYPYAAILDRAAVREASAKSREDMVSRIQEQGMANPRTESLTNQRERQQLVTRLKQIQPSGRMIIHITGAIEKWQNTISDVEVRAGDALYIPKRPNFVMVAGQVYNPSAITFSPGKHAGWYLKQAGGPTSLANKKDIFVVRANGTVVGRNSGEWWSGKTLGATLQPGDTIFVPQKGAGSSTILKNLGESIQLLSGAAVAVSVIRTF